MNGKNVFSLSPREHTIRCSLKIVRAGISALFVVPSPLPIQYTLSTPRHATAGLQDRTHAISNQAVSTLGTWGPNWKWNSGTQPLRLGSRCFALASVNSRLYCHSRGRRTVCRTGTWPWFSGSGPGCPICENHLFLNRFTVEEKPIAGPLHAGRFWAPELRTPYGTANTTCPLAHPGLATRRSLQRYQMCATPSCPAHAIPSTPDTICSSSRVASDACQQRRPLRTRVATSHRARMTRAAAMAALKCYVASRVAHRVAPKLVQLGDFSQNCATWAVM